MSVSPVKIVDSSQRFATDGRGAVTIHLHRRIVYYNVGDVPREKLSDVYTLKEPKRIKIDKIDLLNIPPILADILQRVPNRNFLLRETFWIARVCGHVTLKFNPCGLCELCIVMNALVPDFVEGLFRNQRPWIQEYFCKYHPSLSMSLQQMKQACRAWRNKLNGSSRIVPTILFLPVGLNDTVRERLYVIRQSQILWINSLEDCSNDENHEKLSSAQDELAAMNDNIAYLNTLTTDPICQKRIDKFLDEEGNSVDTVEIVRLNSDYDEMPSPLKQLFGIGARDFKKKYKDSSSIKPISIPDEVKKVSKISLYYDDSDADAFQANHPVDEELEKQEPTAFIKAGQRLFKSKASKVQQPGRHAGPYQDKGKFNTIINFLLQPYLVRLVFLFYNVNMLPCLALF